ncbi:MAG: anaerobic ribonucleoside-triphosphate reductase activating protein [Acutalibacteraceae bacterium]
MQIQGLQRLTLLDFPGRVACTVFCGGCNFRCPFCHNAPLVLEPEKCDSVTQEEFFALLQKRKGVLEGVCVTGGEPLLQQELGQFLQKIHEAGCEVKLDTNGSMPERLAPLLKKGLVDFVAMDLKNCRERYGETVGIPGYSTAKVEESVRLLQGSSIPYEFRTTVVRELHHPGDFERIGRWIAGAPRYFLQAFRDSGSLIAPGLHGCSKPEMEAFRAEVLPFVPSAQLRGMD